MCVFGNYRYIVVLTIVNTEKTKKKHGVLFSTVGSKILLHPNTTPKVSLSHPEGVYDNLRLGGIKDKEEDKEGLLPIPRKQFFYYYLFFWTLYGVMAYLPYVQKNTGYNILDLFAKNGFGIIIVYLIWKINKTCKETE